MSKNSKRIAEIIKTEDFWFVMEVIEEHCENYKKSVFSLSPEQSEIKYSERDVSIRILGFLEAIKQRPYDLLAEMANHPDAVDTSKTAIYQLADDYVKKLKYLGSEKSKGIDS